MATHSNRKLENAGNGRQGRDVAARRLLNFTLRLALHSCTHGGLSVQSA